MQKSTQKQLLNRSYFISRPTCIVVDVIVIIIAL